VTIGIVTIGNLAESGAIVPYFWLRTATRNGSLAGYTN
jgi:hypothetical protein